MPANVTSDRDFRGYAGRPPQVRWPNGARLALSIVVNVEEGAELSIGAGDERNESVYETIDEIVGARDLCMESHFEYGPRAGWPRIRALLAAMGSPPPSMPTAGRWHSLPGSPARASPTAMRWPPMAGAGSGMR